MRQTHPTILAILVTAALLCAPAAVSAQQQGAAGEDTVARDAGGLSVAGMVVTTSVRDRMPADTLSTVPADAGRVVLWTRITGSSGQTAVEHVWYRGDEEMARVSLDVGGSDWRTWSSKRILPSWTGRWRVEVRGPAGDVLETTRFTVEEP
jgi:hypothetical protein